MTKKQLTVSLTALALALGVAGPALAGSTGPTATVQGTVPVLSAPSNSALQAVDFSGTYAVAGRLSTGDTVVLTYIHTDTDGDADDSHTTVTWHYVNASGTDIPLTSVNVPATTSGGQGTSTVIIPAAAVGATAIKVTVQELSATGDPLSGQTITVVDVSSNTSGGGTDVPPGPVIPGGSGFAGGIFLQSDSPAAGSGATDYARSSAVHPQVGKTYVFRAWADANNDGVWDAGEADVTASLSSIQWQLDGTNSAANGSATLSNHAIPGATTDTYTVPVNSASSSGATPGDQGFSLQVLFN